MSQRSGGTRKGAKKKTKKRTPPKGARRGTRPQKKPPTAQQRRITSSGTRQHPKVSQIGRRSSSGSSPGSRDSASLKSIFIGVLGAVLLVLAIVIMTSSGPTLVELPKFKTSADEPSTNDDVGISHEIDARTDDAAVAAARRKELDGLLVKSEAFAEEQLKAKGTEKYVKVLDNWAVFLKRAKDTEYETYALSKIESIKRRLDDAAEARFNTVKEKSWPVARSGEWDLVHGYLSGWPEEFKSTPANEKLRTLKADYQKREDAWRAVKVRVFYEFRGKQPSSWKHSSNVSIDPQGTKAIVPGGSHVKFTSNFTSVMTFKFQLSRVPKPLFLRCTHLSTRHRGRHASPITITINGRVLLGEYDVARRSRVTTGWDIADYVKVGANTISWQLGDARTMYWFYRFEISDWVEP